jgi:hypothetical protein
MRLRYHPPMRRRLFTLLSAMSLLLSGCSPWKYEASYHPPSALIENSTRFHYTAVYLQDLDGPIKGWETPKVELAPGQTKTLSLPEGTLPDLTTVWFEGDESGFGILELKPDIPRGYTGVIRVKIMDRGMIAETVPSNPH